MELDDFKTAWGKDVTSGMTRELLLQKVSRIEKSGRKIRKAVVAEAAIIGVLYLLFIGAIIFFNEQIQSFMYKLVMIISIGFSPIAYRLYQSQRWVNAIDYSADIRSNLVAFLTYYRTTLRWYWWSSVIISALLFVMLFTDEDFLSIPMACQIGTCTYIVLVLLLTPPYLRNFYGKHVKEFEAFLESGWTEKRPMTLWTSRTREHEPITPSIVAIGIRKRWDIEWAITSNACSYSLSLLSQTIRVALAGVLTSCNSFLMQKTRTVRRDGAIVKASLMIFKDWEPVLFFTAFGNVRPVIEMITQNLSLPYNILVDYTR